MPLVTKSLIFIKSVLKEIIKSWYHKGKDLLFCFKLLNAQILHFIFVFCKNCLDRSILYSFLNAEEIVIEE